MRRELSAAAYIYEKLTAETSYDLLFLFIEKQIIRNKLSGCLGGARTHDIAVNSRTLYRLSYKAIFIIYLLCIYIITYFFEKIKKDFSF